MRWTDSYVWFARKFEWHDWFAWHPIEDPNRSHHWIWLETVKRKKVAVGNQGLTGNYEWRYVLKELP